VLEAFRHAYGGDQAETPAQARRLAALEAQYGAARLVECIEWAADSGIPAGRATQAIKTALPRWKAGLGVSPAAEAREAPTPASPAAALDPDEEYLRLNPHGPGREAALERLRQRGGKAAPATDDPQT
jgi:hypothetical protein